MKIAIVTDIHIGGRGDSQLFSKFQEKFFMEVFFPYIDEHDIKVVFDLGDTFDRRKYINFYSLKKGRVSIRSAGTERDRLSCSCWQSLYVLHEHQ